MTEEIENRDLPVPIESDQEQLELFPLVKQQIEIERQRIESNNRRTQVISEAIQLSNATDERQYNYHMAQLESRERISKSKHILASRILYSIGTVFIGGLILLFWMLFFGAPGQVTTAKELFNIIGTAVGGGGVLLLLVHGARRLFDY